MVRRPQTQEEISREKKKDLIKIHNRSKQMIPIHVQSGPSKDFFVAEHTIKLMPGMTSTPLPKDSVNMNQVRNLSKKKMLRVIPI